MAMPSHISRLTREAERERQREREREHERERREREGDISSSSSSSSSRSLRAPTLPAKRANACRLRAVTDSSRPLAHVPAHLAGRHAQRHRVAVRGVGIGGKELSDLPSTDWSP
ncbi:unnamed protein product, partial [Prorocentrum cordatum]